MMRKLALVLFLLLAVQTWGVYGAWQTQKITRTCKMEVGPLCFLWEENTLGKLLGESKTDELEEAMEKAKEKWQKEVADKLSKKKSSGKIDVDKTLKDLGRSIEDGFDKAKEAVEDLNK